MAILIGTSLVSFSILFLKHAVLSVYVFSSFHDKFINIQELNPLYAAIFGGFIFGVGFIILFRHKASLGGFNNKYLLDALRAAETDEVRLQLGGPISPMLVLPKEGDAFSFLVLPVRLRSEM